MLPTGLIPELEAHLDAWVGPEPDAPLFAGARGGPVRVVVWQRDWTRARRALGLEAVRLHDLRHVAGTMAALQRVGGALICSASARSRSRS